MPDYSEHDNVLYTNNVRSTLRQKEGKYYPLCGSSANYSGNKKARIENIFDQIDMDDKTARNGDTDNIDLTSSTRWIKPEKPGRVAPLLDSEDMVTTSLELKSPAVEETAKAARRYHDRMFFRGYFGNGWTGEEGDVAVPFKVANTIAHGAAGITKAKLLAAQEMFNTLNVDTDEEEPILLLTPKAVTSLMNIDEYVKWDYSEGRPLQRYELKPWLGFRFFRVNPSVKAFKDAYSLLTDGTTSFLPCFVPSGVHRGVWYDFKGKISERNDKDHATQIWGAARSAVTRTDEDKCLIFEVR